MCIRDSTMSTALAHALNASLRDSMNADDKIVLIGEDIGQLGGVFGSQQACNKNSATCVGSRRH